jgi:arsenate reductase
MAYKTAATLVGRVHQHECVDNTPKVLFLSRGDASRAQMAEGFLRALTGGTFLPFSAATESEKVDPLAIEVMSEVGIDISGQHPHDVPSLFRETFRYAVAMGDEPRERCPTYPFTWSLLKWSIPNPEAAPGGAETRRQTFRQVRDQIRTRVQELIDTTNQHNRFPSASHAAA